MLCIVCECTCVHYVYTYTHYVMHLFATQLKEAEAERDMAERHLKELRQEVCML